MNFRHSLHLIALVFLLTFAGAITRAAERDPATKPPKAVDELPTIEDAQKHLDAQPKAAQQLAMWLSEKDPSILFIAVRLDQPRELMASAGGDSLEMKPVGDPSLNVFAVGLKQQRWNRAVTNVWVSYPDTKDGKPTRTLIGPRDVQGRFKGTTWRGPEAPKAPDEVETLHGTFKRYQVDSPALGEKRTVSVYLPPGYDPAKPLPDSYHGHKPAVIYFGDGGVVESMSPLVEAMIVAKQIRPVVMVGAHTSDRVMRPPHLAPPPSTQPGAIDPSANADPFANDPRAMEYLEPDPDAMQTSPDTATVHQYMWDRHFKFFAEDLPKWAEQTLGVDSKPESRVLSGFSNSAAFVVTLGTQRASQYAGVIANSVAGDRPPTEGKRFENPFPDLKEDAPRPKFFLSSGTWETHFRKATDLWQKFLSERGAETQRLTIVGGHDQAVWELAIAQGLPWILPPLN